MFTLKKIGALTSKVYAFKARPWETTLTKSLDISDNLGFHISIESKNSKILRVLPRYTQHLKLEWCSDKARYFHESNDKNRLATPYIKNKYDFYQRLSSYGDQTKLTKALIASFEHLDVVLSPSLDNQSLYDAKLYARKLGADCLNEIPNKLYSTFSYHYANTKKLTNLESVKSLLLIGFNPRWETTVANLLIRFRFLGGNFRLSCIGNPVDLTYPSQNYGSNLLNFYTLCIGKHSNNQKVDKNALCISGDSLRQREDAKSLYSLAFKAYHNSLDDILSLSTSPNTTSTAHLNLGEWKTYNPTYLVGAENAKSYEKLKSSKYICETSYVDKHMKKALYLQPIQSYLEKNAVYMRYDGILENSYKALNFGVNSLKPLSQLNINVITKNIFSKWKKPLAKKYFMNISSNLSFKSLQKKLKHFKAYKTIIKTFYANAYNVNSLKKTSNTLLQLGKLNLKNHWHFLAN